MYKGTVHDAEKGASQTDCQTSDEACILLFMNVQQKGTGGGKNRKAKL